MKAEGIDPARLKRAKSYDLKPLGERMYKVGSHYVDLDCETPCHCDDALRSKVEPVACKHTLRALIHERNPIVMAALKRLEGADAR
jgi:hypothetical protein